MIQDSFSILLVLLGAVFLSVWVTDRYKWAERLSAVLWILTLAALASNTGLIPTDAPLYGPLTGFTVPFAVALVLMRVNLSDVRRAGKPMIVAFGVASVGTVAGVVVASVVLDPWLEPILAGEQWRLAGPYTGTYIGGSLNFFALWSGLEIGHPDLFAAANAVDNLSIFPLFAIWVLVPTLIGHRFPVDERWQGTATPSRVPQDEAPARLLPSHVVTLAFLALLVMRTSDWLQATLFPGLPSILLVTTFALALGQLPWVRRLEGAWELGNLAFYLFFAGVGAMIHVANAIRLAPVLFAYVSLIIVGHMVVAYGLGRLLRLDMAVITMASVAAKTGPPMVPAMAEAKGWKELTLPAILMGLFGYAAGNYIGVAVAYLVRSLL